MCDPIPAESNFNAEITQAVGLLFLTSAAVESILGVQVAKCIAHPTQPSPFAPFATSGMDVKIKLMTIERAIQVWKPDLWRRAEKLCSSIRSQFGIRNNLAHSHSSPNGKNLEVIPLKLTAKGVGQPVKYSAQHIIRSARILHRRTNELAVLISEAGIMPTAEWIAPSFDRLERPRPQV